MKMPLDFAGAALPLTAADIAAIAAELDLSPALVHAVHDVESAGIGFLPDNRPVILFESHAFHTQTRGQWDGSHPDISQSSWVRDYGAGGEHQYVKLGQAVALNRGAALQSASWGSFQIMGSNHAMCGFGDVEVFVSAMEASGRAHLEAFAEFCKASGALARLRALDFAGFAEIYNGAGFAANGYDVKLRAAWRKWSANPAAVPGNTAPRSEPDLFHGTLQRGSSGAEVIVLQTDLVKAGYRIDVDGDFGFATETAVEAFQRAKRLGVDGIAGPATELALAA